jgi:uncharacterized damage-inducible protein DinB
MSYADSILPEFDQEMANTRKILERIPEDKLNWQPHPKSHTIGWNANHLAEIPDWVQLTLKQKSFDIEPVGGKRYETPKLTSKKQILELFDKNVAAARRAIQSARDEDVNENWSLLSKGEAIMTMPRAAVIRSFVLNHNVHHRAVLCVYLRLNDIPYPGMYGPSGDEGSL